MATPNVTEHFCVYLDDLRESLEKVPPEAIEQLVERLYDAYRSGRQVLVVGNGGSASTASHMMNDLTKGVFSKAPPDVSPNRFRVLSLTDNMSVITAWANDTSYDLIFAEQIKVFAEPGDLLIVISASGNSPNVVAALEEAKRLGLETIGLLGFGGGKCEDLVDLPVVIASYDYGVVEDAHMILNHFTAETIRQRIAAPQS